MLVIAEAVLTEEDKLSHSAKITNLTTKENIRGFQMPNILSPNQELTATLPSAEHSVITNTKTKLI